MLVKNVSIDLDFTNRKLLAMFIASLSSIHKNILSIKIRQSCLKGFHILMDFDIPNIRKKRDLFFFKLGIRYALGDDYGRCLADIVRFDNNISTSRLFDSKGFKDKNGKIYYFETGDWVDLYENNNNRRENEKEISKKENR